MHVGIFIDDEGVFRRTDALELSVYFPLLDPVIKVGVGRILVSRGDNALDIVDFEAQVDFRAAVGRGRGRRR